MRIGARSKEVMQGIGLILLMLITGAFEGIYVENNEIQVLPGY